MKIAICLSGLIRNFENTFPRFKKYIMDTYEPDIFFYGYPNNNGLDYCNKKLIELYKPKKHIIQEYNSDLRKKICEDETKFKNTRSETKINNLISQLYNIHNCDLLRQQYEAENNFKYDIVLRCRTDVFFFKSFEDHELTMARAGFVLIPTEWDFKNISTICVSDSFAMTNSKSMSKYANLYNKYEKYYNSGCQMHPETLFGKHILNEGLTRIEIKGHGWYKFENLDTGEVQERYGY
jgi:hypothetical protein